MSVIVKGMEMPKCCDECMFNDCFADNEYCYFLDEPIDINVDMTEERCKDCPLLELPEKHGRLIDADDLKKGWENGFYKKIVDALVDEQPTVIEAEGQE